MQMPSVVEREMQRAVFVGAAAGPFYDKASGEAWLHGDVRARIEVEHGEFGAPPDPLDPTADQGAAQTRWRSTAQDVPLVNHHVFDLPAANPAVKIARHGLDFRKFRQGQLSAEST